MSFGETTSNRVIDDLNFLTSIPPPHDGPDAAVGVLEHFRGYFAQPGTKDGVAQVCLGLVQIGYPVKLGFGALSEALNLRKDEPDPMRALGSFPHFSEGDVVLVFLRVQKTLQ